MRHQNVGAVITVKSDVNQSSQYFTPIIFLLNFYHLDEQSRQTDKYASCRDYTSPWWKFHFYIIIWAVMIPLTTKMNSNIILIVIY